MPKIAILYRPSDANVYMKALWPDAAAANALVLAEFDSVEAADQFIADNDLTDIPTEEQE